jgi:hypothetical protein
MGYPSSDPQAGEQGPPFAEVTGDEFVRGGDVETRVLVGEVEIELAPGRDERPARDPEPVGDLGVGAAMARNERDDPRPAIGHVRDGEDGSRGWGQFAAHREFVTERVLVGPTLPSGAGSLVEDLDLTTGQPFEEARQRRSGGQDLLVDPPPAVPRNDVG